MFFDESLTGFALRVTQAGTKVFLFEYRFAGKTRRLRLGRYGDITPAQARALALQARLRVAGGEDPASDRKRQAAALQRQNELEKFTFTRLAERWTDEGLRDRRPRYRDEAARALKVNFAALRDRPAVLLSQVDVQSALDEISARRGASMARRSHAYGRAMYGWAIKRQLASINPFALARTEGRDVTRDRVLSDGELGEVWRAAGELGWPFGPFIRFLMLTLQRESEAAGLRWEEISADGGEWLIPAARTKNGKPHLVHLSAAAQDVLAGLPGASNGRRDKGAGLAFTKTGSTPISGFSRAKSRLDAKIMEERQAAAAASKKEPTPLVGWRFHDLRRTGVTALARKGIDWVVADRLLNHVQGAIKGVAAIYQRHEFLEERKQAIVAWSEHVIAAGEAGHPHLEAQKSPPRGLSRG